MVSCRKVHAVQGYIGHVTDNDDKGGSEVIRSPSSTQFVGMSILKRAAIHVLCPNPLTTVFEDFCVAGRKGPFCPGAWGLIGLPHCEQDPGTTSGHKRVGTLPYMRRRLTSGV
jgi:hypothetical protein